MGKSSHAWSLFLLIGSLSFAGHTLYANIYHKWLLAPPNLVLFAMSLTALLLAVKSLKDQNKGWLKWSSWVTIAFSTLLSLLLAFVLLLSLLAFLFGASVHIQTVNSPDNRYTIDFYRWDAGAAGTFGVRGKLRGPLWFKKRIYLEKRVEEVEVEWLGQHEVLINEHYLKLNEGDTFGY